MKCDSDSWLVGREGWRGLSKAVSATLALALLALGGGLAATALPAYANVTTGDYTIGSPSGAVTSVSATPSAVGLSSATGFQLTFTEVAALSGTNGNWVSVTPSVSLTSSPTGVDLVDQSGSGCFQAGTAGQGGVGSTTTAELTIELASTCNIAAGDKIVIDFTADAPSSIGTFYFTITTSTNITPATSNTISVGTSGVILSAASVEDGANTTYTISNATVENLTAAGTVLTLQSGITQGNEAIIFYGQAGGYSVTYTPSGGTATADTVESATVEANGQIVVLTLATALANNDVLEITAVGTNPAVTTTTQVGNISVEPGNGTILPTNSITFGNSVTGVTVSPSTSSAGASATYVVNFKAFSTATAGGYIFLSETGGPTSFTGVTGILVSDPVGPGNLWPREQAWRTAQSISRWWTPSKLAIRSPLPSPTSPTHWPGP